jgi:hypothetical protein
LLRFYDSAPWGTWSDEQNTVLKQRSFYAGKDVEAAMQQILDRLWRLGLGQFAQRFAENDGPSNRRFIERAGSQPSA